MKTKLQHLLETTFAEKYDQFSNYGKFMIFFFFKFFNLRSYILNYLGVKQSTEIQNEQNKKKKLTRIFHVGNRFKLIFSPSLLPKKSLHHHIYGSKSECLRSNRIESNSNRREPPIQIISGSQTMHSYVSEKISLKKVASAS